MNGDGRTFLQRVEAHKAAQQQPTVGDHSAPLAIAHADAYVAAAQRNELQQLHGCATGTRNDTLNRVALKLGRLPIDRNDLRDKLTEACHANGLIRDDGQGSVDATIRSAFAKADLDGPRPIAAVPGSRNGDTEPGTVSVPGSRNRIGTGTGAHNTTVPGSQPTMREPGTADEKPLYVDISALLDGTLPEPPEPQLGRRTDGNCLFYGGQVNWLFGDPESGKSWLCMACVVEALQAGRKVLIIDLDHNGAPATVRRLSDMGGPHDALSDPDLFRYCEPEDRVELRQVIDDSMQWRPAVAIVDSIGELLPMYGASSNSSDDFTLAHSNVLKPLARAGAAVIAVDHLAKSADSRAVGPGGTAAKRRAIGGVSLRMKIKQPFTPGHGGSATLVVNKDRHGGLRKHCPVGDREPVAGTFRLLAFSDGVLAWEIYPPADGERNDDENAPAEDVAQIAALDPPPTTVEDARQRLKWQKQRTANALRTFRDKQIVPTGTDA